MKQLHKTQLGILKKLLFSKSLRYSKLKPNKNLGNNKLDFHLNQLILSEYIIKSGNEYVLTSTGKEYANRIDTDINKVAIQAKLSVFVCCLRENKGKIQYLIYTRLKQPFYGCQGFPSGKIMYGESVIDTAKRELFEETNLSGDPKIVGLKHFRVYERKTQKLVEDKFMFLCVVRNPKGTLRKRSKEALFEWVDKNNVLKKVQKPFEPIEEFMEFLKEATEFKGKISFQEIIHKTESF